MNIFKKIKENRNKNTINIFYEKKKHVKSKRDLRNLEMALLKPEPIPKYRGKKTGMSRYQQHSLNLCFPDKNHIQCLGKYMKIYPFLGNNSFDTDILISLLNLLEHKKLLWDSNKKELKINSAKIKRRKK